MQPNGSDKEEIERQYTVSELGPVEDWIRKHAPRFGFLVEPSHSRVLNDTYFDTRDWDFHRAGYKFRLRRCDDRFEMTFKALAGDEEIKSRREVSQPIDSSELSVIPSMSEEDGQVSQWLVSLAGSRQVRPMFQVFTQRQLILLKQHHETVVEVALDESRISSHGDTGSVVLSFLELEGPAVASKKLERFIEALKKACSLQPVAGSKFERGLALNGLKPVEKPDVGSLRIQPSMSMGEFVHVVLRRQYLILLEREPGTRIGQDIEELHQMRVATRRMRTAIRLFRDYLPIHVLQARKTLRWIASALGEVRDLDVKLNEISRWIREVEEQRDAFLEISGILERRRQAARRRMLKVLDSNPYRVFLGCFTEWMKAGPETQERNEALATKMLPKLIKPLHEKVLKTGKLIRKSPSVENYHQLRITCKKLRYGLEFISDIYHEADKPFRKRLAGLQEVLGDYNDALKAMENIDDLMKTEGRRLSPRAAFALGRMEERYLAKARASLEDFKVLNKKFKDKPWSKIEEALRESVKE